MEVASASVGGEEKVERGIGGKEEETSWREVWSTLDSGRLLYECG